MTCNMQHIISVYAFLFQIADHDLSVNALIYRAVFRDRKSLIFKRAPPVTLTVSVIVRLPYDRRTCLSAILLRQFKGIVQIIVSAAQINGHLLALSLFLTASLCLLQSFL